MRGEIDAETVLAEWGSLVTASDAKAHLDHNCRYATDRHTEVDTDALPVAHLDLCGRCRRRFRRWRQGLEVDDRGRCERCGCRTANVRYCTDCQLHAERVRARKR